MRLAGTDLVGSDSRALLSQFSGSFIAFCDNIPRTERVCWVAATNASEH